MALILTGGNIQLFPSCVLDLKIIFPRVLEIIKKKKIHRQTRGTCCIYNAANKPREQKNSMCKLKQTVSFNLGSRARQPSDYSVLLIQSQHYITTSIYFHTAGLSFFEWSLWSIRHWQQGLPWLLSSTTIRLMDTCTKILFCLLGAPVLLL